MLQVVCKKNDRRRQVKNTRPIDVLNQLYTKKCNEIWAIFRKLDES